MRTTFFTCCDKKYEYFIPIFLHSILYHNNDVDVEIGVEDLDLHKNIIDAIDYIKSIYIQSRIELRKVNFGGLVVNNKLYKMCPNVVRFLETPIIKNEFVYICDIDIITLQKNITQLHIDDMNSTGLNYSNIVRSGTDKKLTGLHFTKYNSYYPIPDYDDLIVDNLLSYDEMFLYQLVKKKNNILETNTFRPVHGAHISTNRDNPSTWGLDQWKTEWIKYTNSEEFLFLKKYFSEEIIESLNKIEKHYDSVEYKFTEKYIKNSWDGKESKSGSGSSLKNNELLLENLEEFVVDYQINTIIDCGCGDFNWMKKFKFHLIKSYLGVDIVEPLIHENKKVYETNIIKFEHLNVIDKEINEFDMVICKDVLFHLSFKDALLTIDNFKKSRSKYLISTTFYDYVNTNINSGNWRPINLQTEPFLLGDPILLWKNIENKTEGWVSKSIGVWKIN